MTSRPSRPHSPRRAVTIAVAIALAIALAGCASTGTRNSATGSSNSSSSPSSSSSPTSPGSIAPPDGTPKPGTGAAAYPSAIVDTVVDNPAFDALGRDITDRITKAGLPGASLLVLHDGALVEQEAFRGYDLSTEVPIASASKWLTGATLMTLVDDGLIDLDAPIRTYLPEATGPSGKITMRQLVAFTSGLEFDAKIPCYEDKAITLAACNDEILALRLIDEPGAGYRYTGTHLHVAAGVAEAVTGKTWEAIFQERIAGPLGMTRTTFTSPQRMTAAPDGHPAPAGSAVSTLGDYGRFLEMLVHDGVAPDGTRILSQSAIAEMSKDQTGDASWISGAANRKAAETPYGVAHWLDMVDDNGVALVESSPGKFGFRPWIDHVNGVAGVFLIVDRDDARVEDSPDHVPGGAPTVQTSGTYVMTGSAEAIGGKVPRPTRR